MAVDYYCQPMQNIPPKGLILLEDGPDISGLPLFLALAKKLQAQDFTVTHLLNFGQSSKWSSAFSNAGVTNATVKAVESLEDFPELIYSLAESLAVKSVVFIENLEVYFKFSTVDKVARALKKSGVPIVAQLQRGALTGAELARLESVANTVLALRREADKLFCSSRIQKRDGTFGRYVEEYKIDPVSFALWSQRAEAPAAAEVSDSAGPSLPPTMFDMGLQLREDEREAKQATRLPFVHAQQQKGLVGLNMHSGKRVRAGGQIIYTPDAADDLDDSDPDDDLMI